MKKAQITTTAAILFAVATIGIGLANAQGRASAQGTPATHERAFAQEHRGDRGQQLTAEQRTAVDTALEAGDYTAFINAHGTDSNIATRVSETQFNDMVEHRQERDTRREAVDKAIDTRDYAAFVKAVGTDAPFLDHINETNFPQFAEMHDLMRAGDWDGAKSIADELGIPAGQRNGQGQHDGMGMMKGGRGMNQFSAQR
ncbi:MAG: hypothetical protein CO030_01015 [Candidatus Magasanikbacteria bacterium CG_4_9_14_0_2_um_filter_42_11]|uniref:DUF4142 domain-containing protein n=1 Tax=Candidatus Magasanikbacteria bacterium CG_4_9_14_0_2_um_filter_42_11 TaxID=1974643 RepID=A0A2M8FAP8_9BACT|nr:MAG: hypothetical protein COU34_00045 [Candidatus Magasanikbacteria bacterium CG10_big_fil_rev_8_21_14_0_10_43_9]PIY92080.1 MAG: hypothetical protein COY70_05135 [Candidatus Magasanikbacteria bacterium CG_4_10_14_0_8_um_filter_42_12]PJC52796.1 MAG: hypothetical protein CO030_01015 [Candidatus Magasanikbacteria bacterium CG_4_9_14_0_2_um_filter_42_11]